MRVLVPGGLLSFSGHDWNYIAAHHGDCLEGTRFYPFRERSIDWEAFLPGALALQAQGAGFTVLSHGLGAIYTPEDGVVQICLCRKDA